jgi:archaellum component FlaC
MSVGRIMTFESVSRSDGIISRVVGTIGSIVIERIAMRLEDVQNSLNRASDIEIDNGAPRGTFLI